MVIRVGCKFVVAGKNADRFKHKTLQVGQACHVQRSDCGFCLVVHGAVELGFLGKEMVVSAIVLVSLDVPVVSGEGQVGTIDHDVLQYVQMWAAGWDLISRQVLDFIKSANTVRKKCDGSLQSWVDLVGSKE
jgi:hypothetical protein